MGSQESFDRGWVRNIRVFVFVLFHYSIQLIGSHDLFCFSMNSISAHPYYSSASFSFWSLSQATAKVRS